ncbi:hypothetical protein DRF57_04970 [Chryseobacterium rhizosphaerae]|uniref:Uncharacterized protein n=1 Tax=Chryseobacterium rhizosphaerae TaxID=395937 RepID=A0ABX9INZ0_9FLAO|nr:hypothetical protein DRF57_04970 [Chryseobacterium rhizosphaerae]GEN65655.1 hypothetical protein CRH01_02230 [Chryseobacterium rhizosphaerae]
MEISEKVTLNSELAATVSKTNRVGDIHGSDILDSSWSGEPLYSKTSCVYLEEAEGKGLEVTG